MMRKHFYKASRLAVAASACLLAAACARKAPDVTATIPTDYRDRHPIVIAPAEEGIDIFVRGASKLDHRQLLELKEAANDYRVNGQGHMTILSPIGAYGEPNRGAAAVRAALASAGVRNIAQSHYRVEGRAAEQPVRVVYTKLKARTATKCGQWPADLSGFQNMRAENNEPFYNFGCATQNMLANQVADPIDLVRGRTEDGSNTARRLQVIDALRSGKDPSTDYRVTGTKINTTVGTN